MSKGSIAGTYKHSQETKDKIGKSNRGRKLPKMSEEAKKKISDYRKGKPSGMLGKKASDETKKKMSNTHKKIGTGKWRKGVKMSDETKKKISEALSGDKSYAWKGGLMKDKEYVSWSKNKRKSNNQHIKLDKYKHMKLALRITSYFVGGVALIGAISLASELYLDASSLIGLIMIVSQCALSIVYTYKND